VLSKSFCMPEHLGTHLDAPSHFERGQPDVSKVAPDRFFAEGVVIDVGPQASADPEYRLSVKDIERWEGEHGPIPTGAIVLLNTGWGAFWNNTSRYMNQDALGKMHFPGYSAEAARFLVERRKAKGIGIDTLSMDYGPSRDYPVHHIVNGAGRYGLENVANLNLLPPRGFFLVVAPIKIETCTGGPTRIFAILPQR
jgi:kynurenine formamidase